jgi:hypothetical protein
MFCEGREKFFETIAISPPLIVPDLNSKKPYFSGFKLIKYLKRFK